MKAKHQISAALSVFIGLIILTEINRSENSSEQKEPITTVNFEYEIPEREYSYSRDTNDILKTFFPEGKIADKNLIVWTPDLEEKLSMSISEDGKCYTRLDTIIQVDIYNQIELYVFRTESYLKDLKTLNAKYPADISFALVESNGNFIKSIKKFVKKPFSFQYIAEIEETEIMNVGPERKALKIVTKNKLDPQENYETTLINLENLEPLLKFVSLRSNEKIIEDPFQINNGLIKKEVELSTQTSPTGSYDIILNEKETIFDSTTEKLITHFTTKVYRWNEQMELELCYE